jgi:hypothetical protein
MKQLRKIYTCFFLFGMVYIFLSLYKLCNDLMPRYGWACSAIPWHSGATGIVVHWLMLDYDQIISGSHTTLINLSSTTYIKRTEQKKEGKRLWCHHYCSPTFSSFLQKFCSAIFVSIPTANLRERSHLFYKNSAQPTTHDLFSPLRRLSPTVKFIHHPNLDFFRTIEKA